MKGIVEKVEDVNESTEANTRNVSDARQVATANVEASEVGNKQTVKLLMIKSEVLFCQIK